MAENWPILPIWRFKLNLHLVKIKPPFGQHTPILIILPTFRIGGLNLLETLCIAYFLSSIFLVQTLGVYTVMLFLSH